MALKLLYWIRKLNTADYFSIFRFINAPFLIFFIVQERKTVTAILLLASFLTDAIDGYIARKQKTTSQRGAKLDSLGDALTVLLGMAAFIVFEAEFFRENFWFILAPFTLFIIQIIIAWLRFGKLTSFHTYLAKVTAVFLTLFLVVTLVFGIIQILFYLTFGIAILEAVEEIIISFYLKEPRENVKGLFWLLKS